MFPRFREQIGTALDLVVEFSTLGEYRLSVSPTPGAPSAPVDAPGHAPRLGGAGDPLAGRAAVRVGVAGGAAGEMPAATPAAARRHGKRIGSSPAQRIGSSPAQRIGSSPAQRAAKAGAASPCRGDRRHAVLEPARDRRWTRKGAPVAAEQLCLAV
jgi:hypothetical protein